MGICLYEVHIYCKWEWEWDLKRRKESWRFFPLWLILFCSFLTIFTLRKSKSFRFSQLKHIYNFIIFQHYRPITRHIITISSHHITTSHHPARVRRPPAVSARLRTRRISAPSLRPPRPPPPPGGGGGLGGAPHRGVHTGRGTTGGAARVRWYEHSFVCSLLAHSHIYILFLLCIWKVKLYWMNVEWWNWDCLLRIKY